MEQLSSEESDSHYITLHTPDTQVDEKSFRVKVATARLLKGLQKIIKFPDPQEDEKASRDKSSMARLL